MGYLFLVFALLAGVTKGYCGKKTSGFLSGFRDSMMANMIRMGLCIVIGFLIVLFGLLCGFFHLADFQCVNRQIDYTGHQINAGNGHLDHVGTLFDGNHAKQYGRNNMHNSVDHGKYLRRKYRGR